MSTAEEPRGVTFKQAAYVLGLLSLVGSAVIWALFVQPLDSQALQGRDSPDYIGGSILLIPLAAGAVAVGYYKRRWWTLGLSAVAAPLALAAVAYAYHDELRWQRDARDLFARYTHRFPDRELDDPEIMRQTGSYITMCADQRSRRRTGFCLEMITTWPRGKEIQGGFRYYIGDTFEYGFVAAQPFDCFGETVKCPTD